MITSREPINQQAEAPLQGKHMFKAWECRHVGATATFDCAGQVFVNVSAPWLQITFQAFAARKIWERAGE